jgi:hypothetical protein
MIKRAGIGIAFMPKDEAIAKAAPNVVPEQNMLKILEFVA